MSETVPPQTAEGLLEQARQLVLTVRQLYDSYPASTDLKYPFVYWRREVPERYGSNALTAVQQLLETLYHHLGALKRYFIYQLRDPAAFELLPLAKLITDSTDTAELGNVGLVRLVQEHYELLQLLVVTGPKVTPTAHPPLDHRELSPTERAESQAEFLRRIRPALREEIGKMDLESAAKLIGTNRTTLRKVLNAPLPNNFRPQTIELLANFLKSRGVRLD